VISQCERIFTDIGQKSIHSRACVVASAIRTFVSKFFSHPVLQYFTNATSNTFMVYPELRPSFLDGWIFEVGAKSRDELGLIC
jgi:hypothetical protein